MMQRQLRSDADALLRADGHKAIDSKEWGWIVLQDDWALDAKAIMELVLRARQIAKDESGRTRPAVEMLVDAAHPLPAGLSRQLLRRRVLSVLLADDARADLELRAFRTEVLRDKKIEWQKVGEWITTRAKRGGKRGGGDPLLPYIARDDRWVRYVPAAPGTILGRVKAIAQSLAGRYGWSELQAVLFILTDLTPVIETLRWQAQPTTDVTSSFLAVGTRIVITVDPATPPAMVEAAYLKARSRLLPGQRYKEIDEQRLALAAWLTTRPSGESPERSRGAWDKTYPQWKYERLDYFIRDMKQSPRRLLHPDYRVDDLSELSGGIQDLEEGS